MAIATKWWELARSVIEAHSGHRPEVGLIPGDENESSAIFMCRHGEMEFALNLNIDTIWSVMNDEDSELEAVVVDMFRAKAFELDKQFEDALEERISERHGLHGGADRTQLIDFVLELARVVPVVKIDEMVIASERTNHDGIDDMIIQWAELVADRLVEPIEPPGGDVRGLNKMMITFDEPNFRHESELEGRDVEQGWEITWVNAAGQRRTARIFDEGRFKEALETLEKGIHKVVGVSKFTREVLMSREKGEDHEDQNRG